MKIYLIRHAQKKKTFSRNRREIAITEKGEKQAEYFGQFAKGLKIKKIFTSDYKRTKQTAEIIGAKLAIKPEVTRIIREINPFSYIYFLIKCLLLGYAEKNQKQFKSNIEKLTKINDENLLLVTHAGYIRFIASLYVKNRFERLKILVKMYYNLGLTILEIENQEIKLKKFNNVDFLPRELRTKFPL